VRAEGNIQLSEELVEYKLVAPDKMRIWNAGTGFAVADFLERRGLPVRFFDCGTGEDIADPRRPTDFSLVSASLQYGINQN
jgi:hypothetical protein